MQKTNNIFNDFECYKYKNILDNVQIALCNVKQEIEWNKKEVKNKNKCEIAIKIKDELDARYYTYDNINSLLTGAYFIWQLDNYRDDIEVFQVFINNEITYIFDYWKNENERKMKDQIDILMQEMKIYKEFISKYHADKTFNEFKKR